jgi:competence protein ComEC
MVFRKNLIYFLILITISIWLAVFTIDDNLHIIACDVGQGDSILIQKNTTQILIDGGPDNSVLNCLGKYMPFWDRQIELVILTHPEADHYSGLIEVFKKYKVSYFGQNNTNSSSQGVRVDTLYDRVIKKVVGGSGTQDLRLSKGVDLRVGMIYLDILHPEDEQFPINNFQFSNSTNDNGVVVLLKYAQFKALFTADVEDEVSDELSILSEVEGLDYIKVNHHGSKNGLSEKLLQATMAKTAVISVGKKNSYGHPHAEVIKMLSERDIKILRTDLEGDVDYVVKN